MTSDAGPGPLHLILGDEELLSTRAVAALVAAARTRDPDTAVTELDGASVTASDLAVAVSPSLFGGVRVVVVRDGQDVKKEAAGVLLSYAQAADPEITLVVAHAGGAKGRALVDGLRAAGATVTSAARITKHRDRVDFVREEVRRHGGMCGAEGADALITAVGNDLRELAAACAQLVADAGGRVDAPTVARYYRGRAEVSGFTVADAAVVGDVAGALEALRWALHVGVDPVPIADAIADGVRSVARVAGARGSASSLASSLGMPPWKIERAQRQSRGWTPEGLVAAMDAAARCNADVKGGAEDRAYALERTIVAIAAAHHAAKIPVR
jgi:DNA polymerase-3 subunit delta